MLSCGLLIFVTRLLMLSTCAQEAMSSWTKLNPDLPRKMQTDEEARR